MERMIYIDAIVAADEYILRLKQALYAGSYEVRRKAEEELNKGVISSRWQSAKTKALERDSSVAVLPQNDKM